MADKQIEAGHTVLINRPGKHFHGVVGAVILIEGNDAWVKTSDHAAQRFSLTEMVKHVARHEEFYVALPSTMEAMTAQEFARRYGLDSDGLIVQSLVERKARGGL